MGIARARVFEHSFPRLVALIFYISGSLVDNLRRRSSSYVVGLACENCAPRVIMPPAKAHKHEFLAQFAQVEFV